jgi:hypothetical protein
VRAEPAFFFELLCSFLLRDAGDDCSGKVAQVRLSDLRSDTEEVVGPRSRDVQPDAEGEHPHGGRRPAPGRRDRGTIAERGVGPVPPPPAGLPTTTGADVRPPPG